jgi:tripartite-type tricarboxylate transporter receptor subunit TctC
MNPSIPVACAAALSLSATAFGQAAAPAYPAKPVRILVGFAAGGGIDIVARIYAQQLTEALGQSVFVDNRPGAGGTLASDLLAKAPPDGYTLIMVSVTHSINASLYGKLPYDTLKSFAPVTPTALQPDVIAIHPSLPAKTLRDLIALARSRSADLSYAHAGNGTLIPELKEHMAKQGTQPFRDTPAGFAQLISNDVAKWGRIVRETGIKAD